MTISHFESFPQPTVMSLWHIKEEIYVDQVTEDFLFFVNDRKQKDLDTVSSGNCRETKQSKAPSGKLYLLSELKTYFSDITYISYTVWSETDTHIITGNFLDKEIAIMWIEGLLANPAETPEHA